MIRLASVKAKTVAERLGVPRLSVADISEDKEPTCFSMMCGETLVGVIDGGRVEFYTPTVQKMYAACSRARGLISRLQRAPSFSAGKRYGGRTVAEHLSIITTRQNRLRGVLNQGK